MLPNLVNLHDVAKLLRYLRRDPGMLLRPLLRGSSRVSKAWSGGPRPATGWLDIPLVAAQRANRLVTGDAEVGYIDYTVRRHLEGRRSLIALSPACGDGVRLLDWARSGRFARIDGFDVSAPAIEAARKTAGEHGFSEVFRFQVADVRAFQSAAGRYDVIFGEQSLHHFTPLEQVLSRTASWLADDGLLVVNEFCGPTRFQWTRRQLEAVNALLRLLPPRFRRYWQSSGVKRSEGRPGLLTMRLYDPSEAVESSRLRPLLERLFEPVEIREYGGAVLHPLFREIAHNFQDDDPLTRQFLAMCFETEDALMECGEVQSDFIYGVFRKRRG